MARIFSNQKYLVVIFLMLFTFACSSTNTIVKNEPQDLNPNASFEVGLMSDHKDKTYKAGEDIYLYFTANRDCYLTLINISPDENIKLLLPNQYQRDNLAKVGYIYRIPSQKAKFRFRAKGEEGEEKVWAIATLENIPLIDQKNLKSDGSIPQVIISKELFEKELRVKLNSIHPEKWAEFQMTLKIVK
jgi:hypothetical protein